MNISFIIYSYVLYTLPKNSLSYYYYFNSSNTCVQKYIKSEKWTVYIHLYWWVHMHTYVSFTHIHTQTPFHAAPVNPPSPAALRWHFCVAPPCGLPAAALEDSRTRVGLIRTNHQTIWPIDFHPTRPSHLFPATTWAGPRGAFCLQPPTPESHTGVHINTRT